MNNFTYLFLLGLFDENGIANNIDIPDSFFKHLKHLLFGMNGYILRIDEKDPDQFVIGDNPCSVFGNKLSIWGLMMPLSPKCCLLLISEYNMRKNRFIEFYSPKSFIIAEQYIQFTNSSNKIIFSDKYCSLSKINRSLKMGRNM